jgi:cell wall-associated NlpC family hydrolase
LPGVLCLLLGACASAPGGRHAETAADAAVPVGAAVAAIARDMIGVPYRYGGSHPEEGFDCSGLVFYSYARAGLDVPRRSQDLFKTARKIALTQANAGDIVFFQDQAKLSHVGIYLGDGLFVHAPATGKSVSIASLDAAYYQEHLVGVGRLLPN